MAEVHVHIRHIGQLQRGEHQADDFDIAGGAGVAVQLGTELDRAARGGQGTRLGVQHAAGIAQAARAFTAQGVGVDTRHLRGEVGAEAHQAAGLRVHYLEGALIQVLAGAGEQRLQVLDMRGDDQFVAPTLEQVQHLAARDLDTRSLRWQYFLDAIWQQPAVYRCHYAISPLVRAACQQASRQ
ncbi:hypothetical protein D3C75_769890 [compost metagenome]